MPSPVKAALGLALPTTFAVIFFGNHATVDRAAIGRAGAVKAAGLLILLPIVLLVPRP